ncbi:hypothetical protein M0802_008263 [Mischocyttarus mexicanus]|nr:hypothetical protein M0802_008263 [Mischocyttarus mexicanus]
MVKRNNMSLGPVTNGQGCSLLLITSLAQYCVDSTMQLNLSRAVSWSLISNYSTPHYTTSECIRLSSTKVDIDDIQRNPKFKGIKRAFSLERKGRSLGWVNDHVAGGASVNISGPKIDNP